MSDQNTGLPVLLAKPAATLFVFVAGLGIAFGVCFSTQIIPLILGLACFVLLISLSRLQTANLLFAYIIADHLCQFLKRAIFLLGPQPMLIYYGFQLLPTLMLFAAVVSSMFALKKTKFPLSAKLLIGFIAIAVLQTAFSPNGSDLFSRFAGANQAIIPLFATFAGMTLQPMDWRRVARLLLILTAISSVYGVAQLVHGPTVIDRAWALQTGDYSIEGNKVYDYINGARSDFRPYSYYSDSVTWGFFLVLGLLFTVALKAREGLPQGWMKLAIFFAIMGTVATETRSVWAALLGALVVHKVLSLRLFRRPLVVLTGILVAFGLVLQFGQYAVVHWASKLTGSALIDRYMDVGTISARTSAGEIFLRVLPRHVILGDGYTTAGTTLETRDTSGMLTSDYYSHNAIVGILLSVGLPGLLVFGAFLYRWFWEGLRTVNKSPTGTARSQLWIVSACAGMLFTGALTGPLFLNSSYFMLFLGLGIGETIRLKQRNDAENLLVALELNRLHAAAMAGREVGVRG